MASINRKGRRGAIASWSAAVLCRFSQAPDNAVDSLVREFRDLDSRGLSGPRS
jgi:hypothetical protein